jgi:glycosyltransferase involved in cell wall biosynthesis
MRLGLITAGAAGMYCGSCMHDNTLAAALTALGHEAYLIPTFTPITTDEPDVSAKQVFFGGLNVYLEQKFSLFRHTPWVIDRLFNTRGMLRVINRFAGKTQYHELGEMTVSMLRGKEGNQRKEVDKLVYWLATELKPELVSLTNVLLSGVVPEIKRQLGVPIVATLQGDDIFLDALPPAYRQQCIELIRHNDTAIDGYIATSRYYADFMADYLGIARGKIEVVLPGLNLAHYPRTPPAQANDRPPTIGYFARICPEKGLHVLTEAYRLLRRDGGPACRLRISGWLGPQYRDYFTQLLKELDVAGLGSEVEHVECPTLADKIRFLQSLDVLSVPTTYREPKGLYVLEALACGVPVVQPAHGSFPELIEATGGGVLVEPNHPAALAEALRQLLNDPPRRRQLGQQGQQAVHARLTAAEMARQTAESFARTIARGTKHG